jgi:Holliday junction resolvase RusA-like endonuclease
MNGHLRIVLDVPPMAAPRPRARCLPGYKHAHVYKEPRYREWTEVVVKKLQERLGNREPYTGPVSVWIRFAVQEPKKTSLPAPKPDLDNYIKAILDALTATKNVWADDTQVVEVIATKTWAPSNGVVVHITPVEATYVQSSECLNVHGRRPLRYPGRYIRHDEF